MGNKATKEYIYKKRLKGKTSDLDEDLTDCIATLSDMAKKGSRSASFDDTMLSVPHHLATSLPDNDVTMGTKETEAPGIKDKRVRLQRSRAVSIDLSGTLQLTPEKVSNLESMLGKDNSPDWGEMRQWIKWCIDDNIKDEVETFRRHSLAQHGSIQEESETEYDQPKNTNDNENIYFQRDIS